MNTRAEIEADIWQKGSVNREHLFAFLTLIPTSDAQAISTAVGVWLQKLHNDPYYSRVTFPQVDGNTGDLGVNSNALQRILDDLSNYGYVSHDTIIDAPDTTMPGNPL